VNGYNEFHLDQALVFCKNLASGSEFALGRGAGCYDDRFFWLTGVLEAGRTYVRIAWPLWVRVFKCLAQAHSSDNTGRCKEGVRPFDPEPSLLTIALRRRSRVHVCISKSNYRKVSCLGEHNTQGTSPPELTSKVTTEFAYDGTSRGLHEERYCRIDVISELMKCM